MLAIMPHSSALNGVAATSLWPLWSRAREGCRKWPLLRDQWAERLVAEIDFPFEARFGAPSVFHAIRAAWADSIINRETRRGGAHAVVALGEGLDAQLWRSRFSGDAWISVDEPSVHRLRQDLLPADPRLRAFHGSALDDAWYGAVPEGSRPIVLALGLLMYLAPADVGRLLARIAERLPGALVAFDTIGPGMARRARSGLAVTRTYRTPPMPWGVAPGDIPRMLEDCGYGEVDVSLCSRIAPWRMPVLAAAWLLPPLRRIWGSCLVTARAASQS